MKNFFKYFSTLSLTTIILLYIFDFLFTKIYYNRVPRDKVSWIMSNTFPDSLDYVLLGSSRCIHHLQPKLINKFSKQNGLNLGYAASGPVEIKLMLKEVIKNTRIKKAFIQIDTKYNLHQPDHLAIVAWMPYIKNQDIYDELLKYDSKYFYLKNIPFYRYQIFEPKIGIRNVSLKLLGQEGTFIKEKGYVSLNDTLNEEQYYNKSLEDNESQIFKEIIEVGKSNNVELFFFSAPIYNCSTDFGILNKYLPNYMDFSKSIEDRILYHDATHLNHDGAIVFTNLFLQTFFK